MAPATPATLTTIYAKLFKAFGPQQWWPAQTRFEVIVGAILTQNTNWGNVEKALNRLKRAHFLSPQKLQEIPQQQLASLIRPAGYFNIKAKRLKNFMAFFFAAYEGKLSRMKRENINVLRAKLLAVSGIGPETADSILLYALDKPVFVVDAYTKRILYRHGMIGGTLNYQAIQDIFMKSLRPNAAMFNEFHALLVRLGKNYCRPKPLCAQCILNNFHYSLKWKCCCCHKALFQKRDRIWFQDRYRCRACS